MITKSEMAEIDALVKAPPEEHVSAETLGDWLGITANRVHALSRDGVIPRDQPGTASLGRKGVTSFPLRAAIRAYCDHARAGATGRRADAELSAEKLRLAREQADKIAFANARARGELLDAREVASAWRGVVVDLRAALLAVPGRVATRLGMSREEAATLDSEIRTAMEALAHDD
ncbi:MAG: hypothetical protein H5U24_18175 [Thioclava marina]|uniref:hypothetical protein n=1 Tax=Thioclava marina TaxID=1915077 RepID=UPI0019A30655|nr:hypothetical protein [Thioclava marina]MBC7147304.1 hypothetical protein [Thioclava marina]